MHPILKRIYASAFITARNKVEAQMRDLLQKEAIQHTNKTCELIITSNEILGRRMYGIGLRPRRFDASHVFLFNTRTFNKFSTGHLTREPLGFYSVINDFIAIDIQKTETSGLGLGHILLHEMTHAFARSFRIYDVETTSYSSIRTGYQSNLFSTQGPCYGFGLNEAITEKMTRDMLCLPTHIDLAKDKTVLSQSNWSIYIFYIDLVIHVIRRMARTTGHNEKDLWNQFERGYFTGSTRHLDRLDTVFGAGSRKIIELAASRVENRTAENELYELGMIRRYFEINNSARRKAQGQKILEMNDEQ